MISALAYYVHDLNPVIFHLGPLTPRWYGFAYLMGFLAAYLLIQKLSRDGMLRLSPERVPDLVLNGCFCGVVRGGGVGYILFYDLPISLSEHRTPLLWSFSGSFPFWGLLRVNEGGMSAHGGIIFTIIALIVFARKYKVSLVNIGDASCMVVPIGLFFGRIANFINGELYGHPSTVPWAVKFPSELYAPTNGVETTPPENVFAMKQALANFLSTHWADLSRTQVQDFLNNHDQFREIVAGQFGGSLDLSSSTKLTTIKEAIGKYVGSDPSALTAWDIGNWWQHGHNAITQFMSGWFNEILLPRHPSQLYEGLLEGALLFTICWMIGRLWRKDGMASGAFLTFYPIMRIIGEQFRVGDTPAHVLGMEVSKGVLYSLVMLIPALCYWIYWIRKDQRVPWVPVSKESVTPAANPG